MPTVIDQSGPGQVSRPTVMEGSIRIQRDNVEPPIRPASPVPSASPEPVRRVTQFAGSQPQPAAVQASPPATATAAVAEKKPARRIVGVLITYTWRPEGQIFPIREGRNLIGRNPDKCDIVVTEDAHLSEVNSHITFRRSFTVGDMVSMSGTDLNGAPVEETYVRLPNYSTIRTGATDWTFIEAQPESKEPEGGGA
jgi:urease beta subunit